GPQWGDAPRGFGEQPLPARLRVREPGRTVTGDEPLAGAVGAELAPPVLLNVKPPILPTVGRHSFPQDAGRKKTTRRRSAPLPSLWGKGPGDRVGKRFAHRKFPDDTRQRLAFAGRLVLVFC